MSKKMVILGTAIDNKTGGAYVVLSQFMQALCSNSADLDITLLSPARIKDLEKSTYKHIFLNHNRKWLKRFVFEFFFWRSKYEGADILLSFQNTMPVTSKKTKKFLYLHQPLPFSEHLRLNPFKRSEFADFLKKYFYLFMIRVGLRRDVIVIVQTEWMRDAVIAKLHHPKEKVIKVTPAYSFDRIRYSAKKIAPKGYNLFYPALFYVHKNHGPLLEAISLCKNKIPDIKLHLTLRGDEGNLAEMVQRLGIQKHIVWLGSLTKDEVFSWYEKCDALVFPSVLETLGLPLLEAAHFNLPVMASDLPYAREVLNNYKNVEFFDPTDSRSIASCIESLNKRPYATDEFKSEGMEWSKFVEMVKEG